MPDPETQAPKHATAEAVAHAIADWVNKYRYKFGYDGGLEQCAPEEVQQIAKDLGIPAGELRAMASKGPRAADLLQKMLVALEVDPDALMKSDPATMRDLQRLCISCANKKRCQHELAEGTAAAHFHEFCPNAFTLDAIFQQNAAAAKAH
jgi:hypothetical protein